MNLTAKARTLYVKGTLKDISSTAVRASGEHNCYLVLGKALFHDVLLRPYTSTSALGTPWQFPMKSV